MLRPEVHGPTLNPWQRPWRGELKKFAPFYFWKNEEIFFSGDLYFQGLIRDLKNAKNTIHLETYIFCYDKIGTQIIDCLNEAAARGVAVKVIIDGLGTSYGSLRLLHSNLNKEVQASIYHPLPWALFGGLNKRNHRKICIIDGVTAWAGSMNISEAHLRWRDTGVRVQGAGVIDLVRAFEKAWENGGQRRFPLFGRGLVRLNDNWSTRRRLYRDLLRRIRHAKERVWITNAYFVPHIGLIRAMNEAARNGVDVRLMVPRDCDVFFIPWVRAMFYSGLIQSGVRIFEYLPRMLHAKTIIVDQWAVVGSSNLNHRSLRHDLEADIVMTHQESKIKLENQFWRDLRDCYEISFRDIKERSWLKSGSGKVLLLLKNWM